MRMTAAALLPAREMDQARRIPRTRTYNLGRLSRIRFGTGRTFIVDARMVAVFRSPSWRLFATQADCPHCRGPLADGILGGTHLICSVDTFKFDLTSGQPIGHACAALKTYPVELSDRGDIRLYLEEH